MTPRRKRVGIYFLVSRHDQTTDNQRLDLDRVAEERGWIVEEIYFDHGVSGAMGRDRRPELDRLMTDAARGKLDVVAAWSVDRLGRSLQHVVNMLAELQEQNIAVYLHQQQVDGTTTAGKAMLGMCAVFAEFEWNSTRDRIKAGLDRARAEGKQLGRPKVAVDLERQILELRRQKLGKLKIAKQLGCGVSTVQRVLSEAPP
jgi:DNA invertase Pin-like site-specific DNA recombinase